MLAGAGLVDRARRQRPEALHRPRLALVRRPERQRAARASKTLLLTRLDAGDGAGTWTRRGASRSRSRRASRSSCRARSRSRPGGDVQVPVTARAAADATAGEAYGFVVLRRGDARAQGPVRDARHAAGARPACRSCRSGSSSAGDTRKGTSHASRLPLPGRRLRPAAELHRRRRSTRDGAEQLYRIRLDEPAINVGAAVIVSSARLARRPVGARLAGRERRPGLRRHAGQRQQPDDRLPARHRRRGRGLPAHEDVLRRGRLRPRRVHRPLARRRVRPARLGRRRCGRRSSG